MFKVTIKIREMGGNQLAVDIDPSDINEATKIEVQAATALHKYLEIWMRDVLPDAKAVLDTEGEDADRLGRKFFP